MFRFFLIFQKTVCFYLQLVLREKKNLTLKQQAGHTYADTHGQRRYTSGPGRGYSVLAALQWL
jgi:hypothetical protein